MTTSTAKQMRRAPAALVLFSLAAVLFAGCAGPANIGARGVIGPSLPFDTLDQGRETGYNPDHPSGLAIESQKDWEAFWRKHTDGEHPVPPAPYVDFAAKIVVVAFYGQAPTTTNHVEIKAITFQNGTYDVVFALWHPGKGCIVAEEVVSPYHLVTVDRQTARPAHFEWKSIDLYRNPC
jgi:hypothetical protein